MSSEEFTALLEPELPRAYVLAMRLTRNPADAEDLVQEASLLAYRGFGTFKRGTNFRAWLLKVLMNSWLSSRRRRRPEQAAVSLDEVPNAYLQRQAGLSSAADDGRQPWEAAADAARGVLGRMAEEEVAAAIDSLPDDFREVSVLYFLEDLPYARIAELLDIPVGTVRSRLHRGRALLQKRLWDTAVDHGIVPEDSRETRE
jgi:RNA polymerase sigma-70 factor (ECF subfamily)